MTPWSWLTEAIYWKADRYVGNAFFGYVDDAYDTPYLFAGWTRTPHHWWVGVDGRRWFVRLGNNGTRGKLDLTLTVQMPSYVDPMRSAA